VLAAVRTRGTVAVELDDPSVVEERVPHPETHSDLPDELAALRALVGDEPAARRGRRSEQATRSATVYLAERRRRLRRELEGENVTGSREQR
jgi:hypothetical protein